MTQSDQPLPFSAPAARNAEPILAVLNSFLEPNYRVLEIASGTGQHVVHFAQAHPKVFWQPSDVDSNAGDVIARRLAQCNLDNVVHPIILDVTEAWPELEVDAVIVANMLHISVDETLEGLCRGACEVGATWLHIYGPFKVGGVHTSASNEAFHESLKARNSEWGLLDLEVVVKTAAAWSWALHVQQDMPANNFSLLFKRTL